MSNDIDDTGPTEMHIRLRDVQNNLASLVSLDVSSLAWLTHEAEYADDDLTFVAIQNVLLDRSRTENRIYHDAYIRLWPEAMRKRRHDNLEE